MIPTEGAQINLFTAARKKVTEDKEVYWIVDHIPTGGKIYTCSTYTEARTIGNAFLQACSKPQSNDAKLVQESTGELFRKFIYGCHFVTCEHFSHFLEINYGHSKTHEL
jgi:hypothetical protein